MSSGLETPLPASAPGWTRKRIVFLSISGLIVAGILVWSGRVALPFILAVTLAYVLTPLVDWCEARRIPRVAAILLVYAVSLSGLVGAVWGITPRLYHEAVQLRQELPGLSKDVAERWGPELQARFERLIGQDGPRAPKEVKPLLEVQPLPNGGFAIALHGTVDVVQEGPKHWQIKPQSTRAFNLSVWLGETVQDSIDYLRGNALELLRVGRAIVGSTSRGILIGFMVLMCAGYLMHTRDEIFQFLRSLPPRAARPSFDRLLARLDRGLSGVVRGQLMICLVNGVLSGIGFWLFDLKYWPILSLIACVLSIIPIFGAILSSIPAVGIALTQDIWTGVWVFVWIIGIHQLEANLLNPKIIGTAAKLHPVLVVFSLLVGEHFYGLWGALLGVPTLSILVTLFNHFRLESMPEARDSLFPAVGPQPEARAFGDDGPPSPP